MNAEHVFIHCIPKAANQQQTIELEVGVPNQGQITPEKKGIERDEQGDQIVRLNPADYKDHFVDQK